MSLTKGRFSMSGKKAQDVRLFSITGVCLALAFAAAPANCKPLEPEPADTVTAGSTTLSNPTRGNSHQQAITSGNRDARPNDRQRGPRGTSPRSAPKPKRIRYVAPKYPKRALKEGVSGFVTLEFVVNASGEPRSLSIVDSKPEGLFERAALSAVKRWRYEPLALSCVPTDKPTRQMIHFLADP